MIVFPSIDLRAGRCVRLRQGEPSEETVYGDNPRLVAERWAAAGAHWLHIVNLDGAFEGSLQQGPAADVLAVNLGVVRDIASAVPVPMQFGGGLRTLEDMERVLALGVERVILGTVAARQPEIVSAALERFGPDRVAVGIDARDGVVATLGWRETSGISAISLGREMRHRGVEWVIYTDIYRDGMLSGVNVSSTVSLAVQTGVQVIASGGVASLEDIQALKEVEASGVAGVIIGRALYTGDVDLAQAIAVAG